jgi:protein-arginine kinase activator protein McsA
MYARKITALNLIGRLEWAEEIEANIGPIGPKLEASYFHPDIWDAAKSLWRSDHRQQAVEAAARALNAALQKKIERRDVSDASLVREALVRMLRRRVSLGCAFRVIEVARPGEAGRKAPFNMA